MCTKTGPHSVFPPGVTASEQKERVGGGSLSSRHSPENPTFPLLIPDMGETAKPETREEIGLREKNLSTGKLSKYV